MVVNSRRSPPNLWHFPAAAGVELRGTDKSTLIDAVYEFRVRNGGALDTIEREIDDYYCTRWPDSCVKEPSDYGHANKSNKVPLTDPMVNRVSRWAVNKNDQMPKGGYALVSVDEANRRANICVGCEKNRSWRTGCRGCSGSAAQLLMQVRGLRKGRNDVYGCAVAGWDNATASNLVIEALPLSDQQIADLPDRCWRK